MKAVFGISVMAAMCVLAAGCGKQENKKAETPTSTVEQIVKIGDILKTPDSYTNKTVAITGKIIRECPSGCWFDLQEGGAIIHVDLKPAGLAIPQEVGKHAVVEGKVRIADNNVEVTGTKVDVK